ncbi:ABC transporter permease [Streptomyces sp. MMS24-I2-30]|uniref:ABC transporter permease n=1 Tax=Streptomyces sp. MMS24-I2-30 TaxID=3351564 RepID=UPI003896CA84
MSEVRAVKTPVEEATEAPNSLAFATDGPVSPWRAVTVWTAEHYSIFILALMIVIGAFTSSAFLGERNLQNIGLQTSIFGFVTLAEFLIVLTNNIDISLGSVVGLSGALAAGLFAGSNVWLALLVGVAVGAAVGIINGYLVAFRKLESFIVTLGMLSLARGLVYIYTQGVPKTPKAADFGSVANQYVIGIPVEFLIWVVLIAVVSFVTRRTVFGRRIYAVGSNRDAALASGVPVRGTQFLVFVIAGALSGLGGFLLAAQIGVGTPTAGNLYELTAIAGVVIGGTRLAGGKGNVFNTVVGTLIFGVISDLLVLLNVSTYETQAVSGALIIAVIFLMSLRKPDRQGRTARGKIKK